MTTQFFSAAVFVCLCSIAKATSALPGIKWHTNASAVDNILYSFRLPPNGPGAAREKEKNKRGKCPVHLYFTSILFDILCAFSFLGSVR